jgi:hypothetical protein
MFNNIHAVCFNITAISVTPMEDWLFMSLCATSTLLSSSHHESNADVGTLTLIINQY